MKKLEKSKVHPLTAFRLHDESRKANFKKGVCYDCIKYTGCTE